jgi:hypothetical protein
MDVSGLDGSDLDRLLGAVTAFSAKPPPVDVEAAHLSAMNELARQIANPVGPGGRPVIMPAEPRMRAPAQRRLAAGLVGPALAAPLCVVALAAAGVNLPGSLRAPFDAAGIALPNQAPGGVRTVIERASTRQGVEQAALGVKHRILKHNVAKHRIARRAADGMARAAKEDDHSGGGPALAASTGSGSENSGTGTGTASAEPVVVAQPTPPSPAPTPAGGGSSGPPAQGGSPSPQPQTSSTAKVAPVSPPAPQIWPGRGCGDTNHVHARVDECK